MFVGNFGNRAEGAKAAEASHTVGSDGHIGPALNPPTQLQAEPTLSTSWPATVECRISLACGFPAIEDPRRRPRRRGSPVSFGTVKPEEHRTHRASAIFSGQYICRYSLRRCGKSDPAKPSHRAFLHLRFCMLTTRTIEDEYLRNQSRSQNSLRRSMR